ncbi:peptide chain release factor N(5)-glutamine methyltransferase [Pseudidiomarina homiensis]|uniref:peptide chain release factor N(5)-glutamine methyltransferase n=1 Tax=Pseudidiomarina homiensis TaxID=364198 RepID=UPI002810EDD9|nr:peptide chain release factor N(5)-glutamine methyltransferase [Pseudidiomarina homiensis]
MQIQAWLRHARTCIEASQAASATPQLDAEVLLAHVLSCSRTYLHTWPDKVLDEQQLKSAEGLLQQRATGLPVAHLLGEREFWSLPLQVNASTLIPRPDTECLVEQALQLSLPAQARVLDLGTGTGAIALALKSERPQWQVVAVDKTIDAVKLAEANAARLGLAVEVQQSDWFRNITDQRFDLIVSNPPYIDARDPHLQQGDVRFEPHSALVAGASGFADLATIITTARSYLNGNGWLVLEHGWQQAERCRLALHEAGYGQVQSQRDYANLERITFGQWESDKGSETDVE